MEKKDMLDYLNMAEKDLYLLELLLKDEVSEEELASYFKMVNIEDEGLEMVSHISHLCLKTNYEGVPNEDIARIKGVSKFWRTHNAKLIMNSMELIREYNKNDIPVLLCKGIAMRLGYMPKVTRNMWDVDIAVHEKNYSEAVKIAKKIGFKTEQWIHATNLTKADNVLIDLHPVFHKTSIYNEGDEKDIWSRSTDVLLYGSKMKIPCIEDMLVQILSNYMLNIVVQDQKPHIKWVLDSMYLINNYPEIEWDKLCNIAKKLKIEHHIFFFLDILNTLFPGLVDYQYIKEQTMNNKGSLYKLNQLPKFRNASSVYFKKKATQDMRKYVLPWIKYSWYCNCFYNNGNNTISNIVSFPKYIKRYLELDNWDKLRRGMQDILKINSKKDGK